MTIDVKTVIDLFAGDVHRLLPPRLPRRSMEGLSALASGSGAMSDAAVMIPQLSKALRRAILALDTQRFTDWNKVLRQRSQRIKLNSLGITEPERIGPVTCWFNIRLTAIGSEVQGLLIAKGHSISTGASRP